MYRPVEEIKTDESGFLSKSRGCPIDIPSTAQFPLWYTVLSQQPECDWISNSSIFSIGSKAVLTTTLTYGYKATPLMGLVN